MGKMPVVLRGHAGVLGALLVFVLCSLPAAWGQQSAGYGLYGRSTAIDQSKSRAEQEAEQMVSLSADRILFILRQEPGLLLQVKKAVVRKAFEQGRVLDPNDLTDDALFRLIREDDNIRVIATREIEDRQYIRAKPSREELARNLPCRQPMPTGTEAQTKTQDETTQDTKRIPSEEEQYWAKHEGDLDCDLLRYFPYGAALPCMGSLSTRKRLTSRHIRLPNTQRSNIRNSFRSNSHTPSNRILSSRIHRLKRLRGCPRTTVDSCSSRRLSQ